jgi:hypothetical protein
LRGKRIGEKSGRPENRLSAGQEAEVKKAQYALRREKKVLRWRQAPKQSFDFER